MGKICFIVLWLLIFICGGFAIIEVVVGGGNVFGLTLITAGLALVVYIIKLPVKITRD
jgi:hypothetical protein